VALHPLADRFAAVAGEYERGRPEYPRAVTGALAAELSLAPGARVLDLAAGTGKLSRALLAAGLDVVAVEPQRELRERLAVAVGAERALEGLAEAIPLEPGSVQAVTVADAFHWFDHAAALAEIARVLAPAGGLAVVTTAVDWSGASWAHELGSLITRLRPEHPQFDGPPWQQALAADGSWEELREVRISASAPAHPERIADHVASMSWVAAMPESERAATLEQVRGLIEQGTTPAQLAVHYALGLTRLRTGAR
jgi:SAM-dependent methyltransferase